MFPIHILRRHLLLHPQTSGHSQREEIASNAPCMSKTNSLINTGNKPHVEDKNKSLGCLCLTSSSADKTRHNVRQFEGKSPSVVQHMQLVCE